MARYALGRLTGLVGVLLAVSLLTFLMMHSIPGGPFDTWGGQYAPIIPKELVIELEHKYGLDKPILEQYWRYLQSLLRLDFGYSFVSSGRTVNELIAEHWPYSLELGGLTFLFSFPVGLALGIVATKDLLDTVVWQPNDLGRAHLCAARDSPGDFRAAASAVRSD